MSVKAVCPDTNLPSKLQAADGYTLRGEVIRTDGGLHVCDDCAVRCWLQMSGQCVGVVMEYYDGERCLKNLGKYFYLQQPLLCTSVQVLT